MSDFERDLNAAIGADAGVSWLDPRRLEAPDWSCCTAAGEVGGIVLGRRQGRCVGSRDDRHILTVVGAGGGAARSLIVPNLLRYDGSMLVIDPTGELARMTARARREMGQAVVVLDPFGVSSLPTGCFNPLDALDPDSPTAVDDAALIADALIIGSSREPHWTNGARVLLKAVILLTLKLPVEERNLLTVHRLLSGNCQLITDSAYRFELDPNDTAATLVALLKSCSKAFDGAVANIGMMFSAMTERERASIFATARVQLEFLRSPALRPVLERSDVRLADLKAARATLYLCLPVGCMATHSRWLTLIITLALAAFERTSGTNDRPVLMVLNDFAALEHMEPLEVASPTMAGSGVRLWFVVQSLVQLQGRYPSGWQTLIANTGVMTFWANADPATLNFLSERVGMNGHELHSLLERGTQRCLVLAAGQAPVILQRYNSATDATFAGRVDT